MKKVSLLIAMIAFVCGNAFAQMSFDFNQYNAGDKIAQTIGDPWTTWSNTPGSAEDGVFGEAGGSMAAHFTYGNDQVVMLGDHSTGVYDLEFDAYVPEGKNGYFNVLHDFAGSASTWAMQVYLHETNDGQNSTQAPGHGTVHAGSNGTCDLPCVYDEWMHFRVHVDADNDVAELYFNEELMCTWQWSLDSFGESTVGRNLSAMDFFPPENASTSEFYIDNLEVTLQGNDEVLIFDPFEEYTAGNKIAVESAAAGHDWWTTWSNTPGSAEDGVVADYDNTQCGHLTYNNDQVLLLGDEENGVYDLEFDILVPEGKNGYFNILHHFAGSASTWAMQCYLHLTNDGQNSTPAPGHGTIHAGSNSTADVPCVYDAWMHFRLHVDTDNDVAEYYYTAPGEDEVLVCTWQWSLDSFGESTVGRTLSAMDFFPPENAATSEYYLDNFSFKKIGGESAPVLSTDVDEFYFELEEDDMDSQTFTISNDGNSIGDYIAYIDFGEGQGGSATQDIYYDIDPDLNTGDNISGVGLNIEEPELIEVGAVFSANSYAGSVMGTKITKAEYLIVEFTEGGNGIEPNTPLTFRIYGQGLYGQPGALLAEKVLPYNQIVSNAWNTVTFDEPVDLTGYNVWATCEFTQAIGGYPMCFDGGTHVEGGDMYRTRGGGAFSSASANFSQDYGNFHIRITCQGSPVPATWATINKADGSMMAGAEDEITLTVNSIGLSEGDEYEATLIINSNDPENPVIELPITLQVGSTGVVETTNANVIYPNPSNGSVTVEAQGTLAIYNVAGQLVRIVNLDSEINTIDMNVENGVYFFSIYDNNGNNTVSRVVVAK